MLDSTDLESHGDRERKHWKISGRPHPRNDQLWDWEKTGNVLWGPIPCLLTQRGLMDRTDKGAAFYLKDLYFKGI